VIQVRVAQEGSVSRQAMVDLIEPFGVPVMMLEGQRIVAANAASREELGQHIVGQDARMALRHPEAICSTARKARSPCAASPARAAFGRSVASRSTSPIR
jgi:hypothetical protein